MKKSLVLIALLCLSLTGCVVAAPPPPPPPYYPPPYGYAPAPYYYGPAYVGVYGGGAYYYHRGWR